MEEESLVKPGRSALSILGEGGSLHYAPVTGGLILLDKDGKPTEAKIDMPTFLDLQKQEKIKMDHTMRQGHPLFHGRVDIYKLPEISEKKNIS